jgi:hypothetical protein
MAQSTVLGKRVRAVSLAAGALSGCLLVSPLGEFEDAPTSANGGQGQQGGSGEMGGNAPEGGAGSTATGGEAGAGGSGAHGGAGGAGECATNVDCVAVLGVDPTVDPVRCRPSDQTCVALRSNECFLAYGDATDEDAIFLGAFASFENRLKPEENTTVYPLRLAIDELNGTENKPWPGLKERALVVTICDNSTPRAIDDAMKHLAEEVEVAGVLATLKPADLMRAFSAYDSIFYLSPVGRTEAVTTLDNEHDRATTSIWNLLGLPADYADAYVELMRLVEQYLRLRPGGDPDADLKLALVVDEGDAQTSDLGAVLESVLRFNGQSTEENGELFKVFRFTTPAVQSVVDALRAFGPDIVVSAAGPVFNDENGILVKLEAATPAPSYFYVVSPYDASDARAVGQRILGFLGTGGTTDLNERVIAVSIAEPENSDVQTSYATSLGIKFPRSAHPAAIADTGNYYDAQYYLAYAAYASGLDEPLTGPTMAAAFARLAVPDGKPYAVGPDHVQSILDLLDEPTEKLSIESTLGPPDFEEGHRRVDAGLSCLRVSGQQVFEERDVLVYDRAGAKFRAPRDDGFPCFAGFFEP